MNAIGRTWMAKELYEQCPVCDGAGDIPEARFGGRYVLTRTAPGRLECPECRGVRFIKVGVTMGELERLRAGAERRRDEAKPGSPPT